ncbi:MAG: dynamin family protein [Polyangiaceae bacterium]
MPSLVESVSRFMGRVELFAPRRRRGAPRRRGRPRPRQAPRGARARARHPRARPNSLLGLALRANAAEVAWLDHEVTEALSALAEQVPWRADVWLRLGRARLRLGEPTAREALERAVSAPDERPAARLALLDLADLDLHVFDFARASRWLDRIPTSLTEIDPDVLLRRAECALGLLDLDAAKAHLERLGPEPPDHIDPRRSLAWARLAWQSGLATPGSTLRAETVGLALRALLMDVHGAADLVASIASTSKDVAELALIKDVVTGLGRAGEPAFGSAFALAEGRKDDARDALGRSLALGDERAAHALLFLATEARDLEALRLVLGARPKLVPAPLAALFAASEAISRADTRAALDALDAVGEANASWAASLRESAFRAWTSPTFAPWHELLAELHRSAHALSSLGRVADIEGLAMEQKRPLRLAIIGEFNAGKSTFINALLGVDVAPTGVLPTTATLHWVAWAPDPFARVVVRGASDRVVPHAELKPTLAKLNEESAHVERVFIYAPIERLRHVEILDTPGFNAPDPEHAKAARSAFDEAHVVLWLLDAVHAMKSSEVKVLEEIRSLGIPTLVLLNKSDRLKPDELETVSAHVAASLVEAKLPTYRPPIAFSAKLALRARTSAPDGKPDGDPLALRASHFDAVEAVIEEAVVDRADALREHGLRRKARALTSALLAEATARLEQEQERRKGALDAAHKLRAAAARLSSEAEALTPQIEKALEPVRTTLAQDLRPIAELAAEAQKEPSVRYYVAERFTVRLLDPLATEIARAGGIEPTDALREAVRAALVGAASVLEQTSTDVTAIALGRVVRAVVFVAGGALAREAGAPIPEPATAIVVRRLEGLLAAL